MLTVPYLSHCKGTHVQALHEITDFLQNIHSYQISIKQSLTGGTITLHNTELYNILNYITIYFAAERVG